MSPVIRCLLIGPGVTLLSLLTLNLLCVSSSFLLKNSVTGQTPKPDSMMVVLKRLGCFGTRKLVGMLAAFFHMGEGSIEIYTTCFLVAIWLKKTYKAKYRSLGWAGCSHNQFIKNNCKLNQFSNEYFFKGQYLLADSDNLMVEQKELNQKLYDIQLSIENSIGILNILHNFLFQGTDLEVDEDQ
ncbi:hypothetical protein VP01_99g9 [Puccinia sorghi]|uniref:Uncharacterized protein n=1 Tax=Puccinia sorghi TaxID=27349 RepID=A0A0L6U769_9BASI|nr:hypothetical protein VP01_99g9 [Puccinia sorghi]